MKQNFLMLAAIFGALLTGCSNEEIANVETSQQNVIGFNVISNKAQTKATPITPSNLTTTDFDVFAYTEDGTAFMGKTDTDFAHDGVKIVHNEQNDAWTYEDPTELRYWPTKDTPLDFYAVSPGSLINGDPAMHYVWNFNHDSQTIHYTCLDEYAGITDENIHANHDVMYSIAKDQTKDTNNGIVKFTFKHILSQVVFKAKTELDNMEVTIKNITINNAKFWGTFTLPTDATTEPTADNWEVPEGLDTGWYSPTVVRNANISVSNSTEDISSTTPMLTIPQVLTKWTVSGNTKAIAQANNAKQSYLTISCNIKQSDVYVVGSETTYETIYVPFGADWQPGKRYIYTLIFGGGYDENGDPILTPIQFDAETSDWVDAENDINLND